MLALTLSYMHITSTVPSLHVNPVILVPITSLTAFILTPSLAHYEMYH